MTLPNSPESPSEQQIEKLAAADGHLISRWSAALRLSASSKVTPSMRRAAGSRIASIREPGCLARSLSNRSHLMSCLLVSSAATEGAGAFKAAA